jgi:hypothetical protein
MMAEIPARAFLLRDGGRLEQTMTVDSELTEAELAKKYFVKTHKALYDLLGLFAGELSKERDRPEVRSALGLISKVAQAAPTKFAVDASNLFSHFGKEIERQLGKKGGSRSRKQL